MAIGDRQLKITKIIIGSGQDVPVYFVHRIQASNPATTDFTAGAIQIPWTEFLALLSTAEKNAIQSIRDKMALQVKARIALLSSAEVL